LKNFGAELSERTAAVLDSLGAAVMESLSLLLAALDSLITALLQPATAPMTAQAQLTAMEMNNSYNQAEANITSSGNITPQGAAAIQSSETSPLFQDALYLSIMVSVAIGIITVVSGGMASLSTLVLGLLISILGTAAITVAAAVIGVLLVYGLEGVVNGTQSQLPWQNIWRAIADSAGWFSAGFGSAAAVVSIRWAQATRQPMAEASIGLVFSILAVVLAWQGVSDHSWSLILISLGVSLFSAFLDVSALRQFDPLGPTSKSVASVSVAIDAGTGGIAFYEAAHGL
jgi:hypothetical protein